MFTDERKIRKRLSTVTIHPKSCGYFFVGIDLFIKNTHKKSNKKNRNNPKCSRDTFKSGTLELTTVILAQLQLISVIKGNVPQGLFFLFHSLPSPPKSKNHLSICVKQV